MVDTRRVNFAEPALRLPQLFDPAAIQLHGIGGHTHDDIAPVQLVVLRDLDRTKQVRDARDTQQRQLLDKR